MSELSDQNLNRNSETLGKQIHDRSIVEVALARTRTSVGVRPRQDGKVGARLNEELP